MATKTVKLTREEKARKMFVRGVLVTPNEDGWEVKGSNGNSYEVSEDNDGTWNCTCPDYLYRGHGGELCKHILLTTMVQDAAKLHEKILSDKHDIHLHREKMIVVC